MAAPISQFGNKGSLVYGRAATVASTVDITLTPGMWWITLFVNANGGTSTIAVYPFDLSGTVALSEEPWVLINAGSALASFNTADIMGPLAVSAQNGTSSNACPVGVLSKIRIDISAGTFTFIDYLCVKAS